MGDEDDGKGDWWRGWLVEWNQVLTVTCGRDGLLGDRLGLSLLAAARRVTRGPSPAKGTQSGGGDLQPISAVGFTETFKMMVFKRNLSSMAFV